MTDQPTLFDQPAPRRKRRHTAPTSEDAYASIQDRTPSIRLQILHELRAYGPMTREQIARRMRLKLQTVCGRVRELVVAGLARDRIEDGRIVKRDGGKVVEATYHTMRRAG